MRLGCVGCSVLAVGLLGLGVIVGGSLVFSSSIFNVPERAPTPEWTVSDGQRAQQKILELIHRDTGKSSRTIPVVFSEREINAFLARHLDESARIHFSPLVVKLDRGMVVVQGMTPLRFLMREAPFRYLAKFLPASRVNGPVWVVFQGRVRIDPGKVRRDRKYLRIEPTEFRIGTRDVGTWFLPWMVGRELFRWGVPNVIDGVLVEDGFATVITETRQTG